MAKVAVVLIHPLQRLCPRRIAFLPTCRLAFTSKDRLTSLRIDTFLSNDQFYTIGSRKTTEASKASNACFLDLVSDYILIPAQEKLSIANPQLRLPSNESRRSEFQGLPDPFIPYERLEEARDLALEASVSLYGAYLAILEDEEKEKAENESDEENE